MEDAAKESAANYEKRRARLRGPKADFANKSSTLNASPLAFEKSIGQRKGESIESPNNEAKLGQRIQEVADRHGLTIFKLPSDLSPRLDDVERDSGIKVAGYGRDLRAVRHQDSKSRISAARFVAALGLIFKKRIGLVGSVDGKSLPFDGLLSPDDTNTIIIDADAISGWAYLLGHELGHSNQQMKTQTKRHRIHTVGSP